MFHRKKIVLGKLCYICKGGFAFFEITRVIIQISRQRSRDNCETRSSSVFLEILVDVDISCAR
jgi:hypothetical protein